MVNSIINLDEPEFPKKKKMDRPKKICIDF